MKLRWSPAAAGDLEAAATYLQRNFPSRAKPIVQELYNTARSLRKFPRLGRPGSVAGTRELAVGQLPYVIVYAVGTEVLDIVRILHSAQEWPPPDTGPGPT